MIDLATLSKSPLADQWWRLNHLYTIRDKQGRLIPFKPNAEQTQYYRDRHTCNHIGKARQLGFSTFHKILALDAMLFPSGDSVLPRSPDGIRVGHIDFTIEDAKKKLRMVTEAFDNLDNADLHPGTAAIGGLIKQAIPMLSRSKESIEFANGSGMWIGTSLRGSTPQILDVSELGKIAYFYPLKAEEIRSGALNTIAPGNVVNIESTHEGGEAGLHYELLSLAMQNDPTTLSLIDFKFHFFPWWTTPDYSLKGTFDLRPEIVTYFDRVERTLGRTFTMGQKRWYDRTQAKQRYAMLKEFPTTPGEMFEAINQSAIYGKEMADLVAASPPRILDFGAEAKPPVFTFWDIGMSDYTSIWLIQPLDRFFLVLDWLEDSGRSASAYAEAMRGWETKWAKNIAGHFLPHDADAIRPGEGKSFATYLNEAGLHNVRIVPRTTDVWLGIGHVRDVLPHCYFHKKNCDTPREDNGEKLPSGVACLKGYHRDLSPANKSIREMPAHDQFSHSADAFRTFGEAYALGLLDTGPSSQQFGAVGTLSKKRRRR